MNTVNKTNHDETEESLSNDKKNSYDLTSEERELLEVKLMRAKIEEFRVKNH